MKQAENLEFEDFKRTTNHKFSEAKGKINNDSNNTENTFEEARNLNSFMSNPQNHSLNNNTNNLSGNTKSKQERVYNIIMRMKTCPDASVIIPQLFGENIIEKLISTEVEMELIDELDNIVREIDELKMKAGNNNTIQEKEENYNEAENKETSHELLCDNNRDYEDEDFRNHKSILNRTYTYNALYKTKISATKLANECNVEKKEDQSERIINMNNNLNSNKIFICKTNPNLKHSLYLMKNPNETLINSTLMHNSRSKSNRSRNKNYSKAHKNGLDDSRKECWDIPPKFEGILRNYGDRNSKGKIFFNFCRKASGYFDAPLQTGGASKLKYDSKLRFKASNWKSVGYLSKSAERSKFDTSFVSNKSLNYQKNLLN